MEIFLDEMYDESSRDRDKTPIKSGTIKKQIID